MRTAPFLLTLGLALPAAAGEPAEMGERLGRALQGLFDQLGPALEQMDGTMEVLRQVDDPANYAKPRVLPNGDILIPRKPGAPVWVPPEAPDEEAAPPPIELPEGGTPI